MIIPNLRDFDWKEYNFPFFVLVKKKSDFFINCEVSSNRYEIDNDIDCDSIGDMLDMGISR